MKFNRIKRKSKVAYSITHKLMLDFILKIDLLMQVRKAFI